MSGSERRSRRAPRGMKRKRMLSESSPQKILPSRGRASNSRNVAARPSTLPLWVLHEIMRHLDNQELLRMSQTCRALREFLFELAREFRVRPAVATAEGAAFLEKMNRGQLRSLTVDSAFEPEMLTVLARLDRVTVLNLAQCDNLTEAALETLCTAKQLEVMAISFADMPRQCAALLATLPKLVELHLSHCADFDDAALGELLHMESLQRLALIGGRGTRVTPAGIASLCALPNLTHLSLRHLIDLVVPNEETMRAVGTLTGLRHLTMSIMPITPTSWRPLAELTQLESLNAESCFMRTSVACSIMGACPRLCCLNVGGYNFFKNVDDARQRLRQQHDARERDHPKHCCDLRITFATRYQTDRVIEKLDQIAHALNLHADEEDMEEDGVTSTSAHSEMEVDVEA